MIDLETLEAFGTSNTKLRAIFTQGAGETITPLAKQVLLNRLLANEVIEDEGEYDLLPQETRDKYEQDIVLELNQAAKEAKDKIRDRTNNGRMWNLRNYRTFMAADLSWNTPPLQEHHIPIMAWAMGKIDLTTCQSELKQILGDKESKEFFVIKDGKAIGISETRLQEININLVRPYIRRAVAALSNKYNDLHPFLSYDPASRSMVGKLRADILNQRVQAMVDQFGLKRLNTQMIRNMFLHSFSVAIKESDWVCDKQMHRVGNEAAAKGWDFKETITREGVRFVVPHPTRFFYDQAEALPNINHGDGPKWFGYWDVIKFADIKSDPGYFNRDAVTHSSSLGSALTKFQAFFDYYYEKQIKVPDLSSSQNPAEKNQRDNAAYLSDGDADEPVWISHYYEEVVPSEVGLGDYPYPVWLHLTVAGDDTICHAEWLTSNPAFVYSYDEADHQVQSISKALDIIPYQESIRDLYSQMVYLMRVQSLLLMVVDADIVPKEIREQIKDMAEGNKLLGRLHVIEKTFLEENLWEQTYSQKKPIEIISSNITANIQELIKGIATLSAALERNIMMSPNELGQFNQRETAATEVVEVSNTSNALNAYKSEGVDEGRQALKKILYESFVARGSTEINLSIQERYPDEVIAAAGFDTIPSERGYTLTKRDGVHVTGTKEKLIAEYLFTSRDGSERAVSVESAKALMELWRYILSSPEVFSMFIETYGMEQITMSVSELFRMAGSPITLKLPADFTEEGALARMREKETGPDERAQIQQTMEELVQKMEELGMRLGAVEEVAQDYIQTQQNALATPPQPQPM